MKILQTKMDWRKWRVVAGIYLLTNIVFVVQRVIFDLQRGRPQDIFFSLTDLVGFAGIWIIFTIPILRMTSRSQHTFRGIIVLVIAGVVLSFFHAAFYLLFAMAIPGIMTSGSVTNVTEYITTVAGLSHAWRFLSFGFLVVVSYAYDYYYLSKERERRAAQLQVQLTEAKLNALKMQMHPHFLFNTLNAISVLVDENPVAAKQTLAQLSDLLRMALENVETQEVPLRRELEFLDRYLLIQKTRYGDRLNIIREISNETIDAAVPYLMLQPVVENALKHGIDIMPGSGTLTVSSVRNNGELVLRVEDKGPGPHAPQTDRTGGGLGLANTRARLYQLYREAYTLDIENVIDGYGTSVTLRIPFKKVTGETYPENRAHGSS